MSPILAVFFMASIGFVLLVEFTGIIRRRRPITNTRAAAARLKSNNQ
jgi:hypothetical protein